MPKCDVCGNDYDKTFQITQAGRTLTFDTSNARSTRWRPHAPIAAAGL
jgi:hypothetical protein